MIFFFRLIRRLTEEIEDFFKYITPTSEEHAARESIVNQLKELITAKWPEAELHVFGSFRTNLYLPTGDIDLVSIIAGSCDKML